MKYLARVGALFLAAPLFASSLRAQSSAAVQASNTEAPRVQHLSVRQSGEAIEIEIQTSTAIVPESQTIPSPDRIIVDFPGALPAADLRPVKGDHGALKAIRTGLFSANPPITRVVLDLAEPQPYQIVTRENIVTLKLPSAASPGQAGASPGQSAPAVTVNFQHGMLRIHAKGATLAEVLFEVQKQTGAEIPIPAGAEQEMVAADLGPGTPREVLAGLLNGSRYNFVFIDNDRDHTLQKAILTLR